MDLRLFKTIGSLRLKTTQQRWVSYYPPETCAGTWYSIVQSKSLISPWHHEQYFQNKKPEIQF